MTKEEYELMLKFTEDSLEEYGIIAYRGDLPVVI